MGQTPTLASNMVAKTMTLKDQRLDGKPMAMQAATVPFSLFQRDYAGQNFVPLQEPWSYAEFHIKNSYPPDRIRNALAYVQQAQSFYVAAKAADRHACPLLWYYCFLNLTKALLIRTDPLDELASGMHGISDPVENKEGYVTLGKQTIKTSGIILGGAGRYQVFPNLCRILAEPLPVGGSQISIKSLLRRVLGIHRAYMKAFGEDSHFAKLREPEFMECPPPNGPHLWLRFFLREEDFNSTMSFDSLQEGLQPIFNAVTAGDGGARLKAHCFESQHLPFAKTANEDLPLLMAKIRPRVHALVLPRGYLYYAMFESELALPQTAAIYAIMFYLGSIVRYRPYDFDKLVEKKHRWVIDEFLQIAPKQFIILMVNEITQSEISYFEG
jgi:YaaC-like Protein